VSVRSVLYALALLVAGAALFVIGGLSTVAFLADRHCGAAVGYYGCETPVANVRNEGDQAPGPPVGAILGLRTRLPWLGVSGP
jgi:hypothetical protein